MAITRVQSAKATVGSAAAGSAVATLGSNATAGNWIVIAGSKKTNNDLLVAVSGQAATTPWRLLQSGYNATGFQYNFIAVIPVRASASNTVTVSSMSSTNMTLCFVAVEYAGVNLAGDQFNATFGNSTSPSSGAITTLTANELIVSALSTRGQFATEQTSFLSSASGGFSSVLQTSTNINTSNADTGVAFLEQIVTSTGTYTAGGTISSNQWAGSVLSLQELSSGGKAGFTFGS